MVSCLKYCQAPVSSGAAWGDLPDELVIKIAGDTPSSALASLMRSVCPAWRRAINGSAKKIDMTRRPGYCLYGILPEQSSSSSKIPLAERFPEVTAIKGATSLEPFRGMQLTDLECCSSSSSPITSSGLRTLRSMPLTSLSLGGVVGDVTPGEMMVALRGMPLEKLHLAAPAIVGGLTGELLGSFRSLTSLSLLYGTLQDQDLVALRGLPLRKLSLGASLGGGLITDGGLGVVLRGMSLTELAVHDCRCLTVASLELLRSLPLSHVRLEGSFVSNRVLAHVEDELAADGVNVGPSWYARHCLIL